MTTFAPGPHDLGAGLALAPMTAAAAALLGPGFAAIDPWASYPYPAGSLTAYLGRDEPGAPRFLVTRNDEPAGAVGLRGGWLRGPYIQFLGVLPAHQGAGTGARVIEWIEHQARHAKERNLWVAASDFNVAALRFYGRHGFERVASIDDLVLDGRCEVLLRKRLQIAQRD